MTYLSSLNPQQKKATTIAAGPLIILAGAGTGKTKVIINRIRHLIKTGVPAHKIAAMTFTNKAAKEMKERLHIKNLSRTKQQPFVGTFHRFCLQILRQFFREVFLEKNFTLLPYGDQINLVKQTLEENHPGSNPSPAALLHQISTCKSRLLSPQSSELSYVINSSDLPVFSKIYQDYETLLSINNALDFDDCILKTWKLLVSNKNIKELINQQYLHILVDEFQDTNSAQFALLQELAPPNGNICVVGDDDQSIYSWRGAIDETFTKFIEHFSQPQLIKLEQNYRCSSAILDTANALIINNKKRTAKTLWSTSQNTHKPILIQHLDSTEEAKWVAKKSQTLIQEGAEPRDIVIIYRTNKQAKIFEMSLRQLFIPYKTYGGQSFFEKKEIQDFMAYLQFIINEKNSLSFWRIINSPQRGVGIKTKQIIAKTCETEQISLLSSLSKVMYDLNSQAKKAINKFLCNYYDITQKKLETANDLESFAHQIIEKFDLVLSIHEQTKKQESRELRLKNLMSIPYWLKSSYEEFVKNSKNTSVDAFLSTIALENEDNFTDKKPEATNSLSLMTIHASKGLEFSYVFICGIEDGQIPHKNSLLSANSIEEERRLLYVAMTRAKFKLFLSYALSKGKHPHKIEYKKSRFLNEIPEALLDIEKSEINPNQSKKALISSLEKIRLSLDEDA